MFTTVEGKIPQTSGKSFFEIKMSCRICIAILGATAELHLFALPTNKFIQFLHHCLPSTMLTISLLASTQVY